MQRKRLLVAEDDGIVARGLRTLLESLGYDVCGVVSTAEAAVDEAGKRTPDLVLMDVHLAGDVDGVTAAEEIYVTLGIPVVLLTGDDGEETMTRGQRAGVYGQIPKPATAAMLRSCIGVALAKHDELRRTSDAADFLRSVVNALRGAVVVVDGFGVVAMLNDAARELLARPGLSAVGQHAEMVLPAALVHAALDGSSAHRRRFLATSAHVERGDGVRIRARITAAPARWTSEAGMTVFLLVPDEAAPN